MDDIINYYQKQIEDIEKKIEFYKKVNNETEEMKKQLKKQKEQIDSQYHILNIIMSNSFIKANGLLRNVQLHTLEMLKFIDNICNKYGFTYWLDFGTLIGAIRHDGFIPWDDEVDMAMPRLDFEKFLEILPSELNRFDGLNDKLNVRKGNTVFKNAEITNSGHSPVLQFVSRKPLASVEVYPIEYINIDENKAPFNDFRPLFAEVKNKFKEDYVNGRCTFEEGLIEGNNKLGISTERTNFMSSSIDGVNRKPSHITNIFPIKRHKFENYEFNIPNNPIEYLSTYYGGNVMNIPTIIEHHNFTENIKEREKDTDLEKLYEDTINFWRKVNENF